jgi:hypothetical protein
LVKFLDRANPDNVVESDEHAKTQNNQFQIDLTPENDSHAGEDENDGEEQRRYPQRERHPPQYLEHYDTSYCTTIATK